MSGGGGGGGNRSGPPKHQNRFAWKPNSGVKINPTVPIFYFLFTQYALNFASNKLNLHWIPIYFANVLWQEVGGQLRPLSEITGVCARCKEQIDWKRKYGKYKPLTEPAKWYFFALLFGVISSKLLLLSFWLENYVTVSGVPREMFGKLITISALVCLKNLIDWLFMNYSSKIFNWPYVDISF